MNARDGKLDSFHNNNLDKGNIEKGWPFHTEYWTWKYNVCIYVIRLYNTGERSEPEKIVNNKLKTTFGPPLLLIKPLHKTPPLTNLRGGPDPRSPLWIRAWTDRQTDGLTDRQTDSEQTKSPPGKPVGD